MVFFFLSLSLLCSRMVYASFEWNTETTHLPCAKQNIQYENTQSEYVGVSTVSGVWISKTKFSCTYGYERSTYKIYVTSQISISNGYHDAKKPWNCRKTDVMQNPFCPFTIYFNILLENMFDKIQQSVWNMVVDGHHLPVIDRLKYISATTLIETQFGNQSKRYHVQKMLFHCR